jgi:hypothetical protein
VDALLAPWLEDIMKALMRSRMSLFTACTAAFAGGLAVGDRQLLQLSKL